MACIEQQVLIASSKPLIPFLGAAFLLMLGFGRLLPALWLLIRGRTDEAHGDPAVRVPWTLTTTIAKYLAALTNIIAYLYVPAALLVGVGLAGEMIIGRTHPILFYLDLSGIGLGLLTTVLLLVTNWVARRPAMTEAYAQITHDAPARHVNQALRNRGTSRAEIVLATVAVMALASHQALAPADRMSAERMVVQVVQDCPEVNESGADFAALPDTLPEWQHARLPSRSIGGVTDADQPGETPPEQESVTDDGLLETKPSTWTDMAGLVMSVPDAPIHNLPTPEMRSDRPVLRPAMTIPQYTENNSPATPPPNLFGTIAQETRMAPDFWQIRVRTGIDDFRRCLTERLICDNNADHWLSFVESARDLEEFDLFLAVNSFINNEVRFQSDSSLAAVLDDWVTPASLVNGARGDCEDFALAKFWMLEMLGIDRSDLYVVVVQDEAVHLPHAYLAVRSGGEIWLLDSRTNRPLLPEELEGIVPVVTIGHAAAYLHGRPVDPGQPMSFYWDELGLTLSNRG